MSTGAPEESSRWCSWACRLRAFATLSVLSAAMLAMARYADTWRNVLLWALLGLTSGAAAVACLTSVKCPRRETPATESAEVVRLREELALLRATMAAGGAAPVAADEADLADGGGVAGDADQPPPFGIPGAAAAGAAPSPGAGAAAPTYAPAGASALGDLAGWAGAAGVKTALMTFGGTSSVDPYWAFKFWSHVAKMELQGEVSEPVVRLLRGHGYVGNGTVTARGLDALDQAAPPALGGTAGDPLALGSLTSAAGGSQETRWGASLPPDLQRAGAEIYRSMRAEGCTSVRDWLSSRYSGSRSSPVWTDLWTMATTVDFAVKDCGTEEALMRFLGTNDLMEISLRRLAAYMYESRSGDRTGALHMLGVSPPGSQTDVAPSWLVQAATAHSKAEHQRSERVAAQAKRQGKGDKDKPPKAPPKGPPPAGRGRPAE
ncbi:unnamed protein product [Prorocentrum cordatum]|uniref:Uncharacterized protein n=1 Tax=Prorocentrum cordatum TaxID=2364126 RepID=A0ABN9T7D4_9DINO|nr:unnamed protein product [Polarella glacialis]